MNNNPKLNAALAYAAKGWAVLPLHAPLNGSCTCGRSACSSVGKHPATPNGLKNATTDAEQIKAWWAQNQHYNVGIVTGKASGVLVLDVDDAKGGTEGFEDLEKAAGPCGVGLPAVSGGGRHFYFKYPEGLLLRNKAQLAGFKGIDTRGEGGYIVAPPSVHANGNTYRWLGDAGDALPDLPDGLLRLLEAQERPVAAPVPGVAGSVGDIVAQLQVGNRNTSFARLVGSLWTRGLDAGSIQALLLPLAKQSGFPEAEFGSVLQSITSRPRGNMFHASQPYRVETETEWAEPEVLSLADFVGREYPDQPWIIEPFLPVEGAAIMAGMEGQGKTWISLDMALDVAADRKWLGEFQTKKSGVLILDQESNPGFLQKRVRGLLSAKGLRPEDLEITFVFSEGLRFLNPRALESFKKILEEKKPAMVIVDSFIRAFGDDENSAQHVARFLAQVKRLAKDHHTAFLLTDHHKKGNPGFASNQMIRGSSDKAAWADVVLTVWNDEGEINIDHTKHRWSKKQDTLLVELASAEEGVHEVKLKGRKSAREEADLEDLIGMFLVRMIEQGAKASRKDLVAGAKEAGISEKTLDAGLKIFVGKGLLVAQAEREEGKRGKPPVFYRWKFGARAMISGDMPEPRTPDHAHLQPPSEMGA